MQQSATKYPELATAAKWLRAAWWLEIPLLLAFLVALWGAFVYAPTERVMGEVQRIFYFHVGSAAVAFFAFFIVFIAGILYLVRRNVVWDQLAATSVEVGVVFTTIVLTTGPIWAKPVWNTWFPWGDPRVMTTLVLWLIYMAYLILRSSLPEGDKKYKFCAVFGIIGFIDVPIVWMSIRWWRTIHPVVITSEGANLEPRMSQALLMAIAACMLSLAVLTLLRGAMRLNQLVVDRMAQDVIDSKRSVA
ncbi:MAG: cytochrome c biogenesis protein CcsA [Acidobacteriota bacterium]|nr:MAG: cytochrome c biogenesis protein CcsA [Acidobacteriota bacterium]